MKKIIFLFLILINFQLGIFAQTNSECPTFFVEEPNSPAMPFRKVSFSVKFNKNFDSSNLKFLWTLSSGKIISGQGTSSIVVKIYDNGNNLTATIQLKGLPPSCNNTASGTAASWDPPLILLADSYSKISSTEKTNRLKSLAERLQGDSTTNVAILKSFPRNFSKTNISKNLKQTLKLFKRLRVDASRYSFGINYDADKENTSFYIVPAGAIPPEAKENLSIAELEEKLRKLQKHKP